MMKTPLTVTLRAAATATALLTLAAVVAPRVALAEAKPGWIENQAAGLQTARSGNKLVLMDFTGSDWCGWCKKLDREVFATPEFQEYARKNLVLVELDFPRQKPMAPETKKQNAELAQQYRVQGYPTIIVLNSAGKKVGELGYMEGGAKAFIAALEKLPKA